MKKTRRILLLLGLACYLFGCDSGAGRAAPDDGPDDGDDGDTDSCGQADEDTDDGDTECEVIEGLSYLGLFDYEPEFIAENVARVLDIDPVEFSEMVSTCGVGAGLCEAPLVEVGYEYVATNDAWITIWVDAQDRPIYITYVYTRFPATEDHLYGLENIESDVMELLPELCVELDGAEEFEVREISGAGLKIYQVTIHQVFEGAPADPHFHAEYNGMDGNLDYFKLPRWYTNLDEICHVLTDEELQAAAMEYFEASEEVVSLPGSVGVGRHTIMDDRPCKVMGPATIDEWGSVMFLHMDIQTGDLVYVERMLAG